MARFLKTHQDAVLVILAVLFLGILAAYFAWSITTLAVNFNRASSIETNRNMVSGFNLDGARAVNFKGLTPQ